MKRTLIFLSLLAMAASCTGSKSVYYDHPVSAEYGSDYTSPETFSVKYADCRGETLDPDLSGADLSVALTDEGYVFYTTLADVYHESFAGFNSLVVETSGYAFVFSADLSGEDLLDRTIRSGIDTEWIVVLPGESADLANHSFTDVISAQCGGTTVPERPFLYAYNGAWSYMGEVLYSEKSFIVKLEKRL